MLNKYHVYYGHLVLPRKNLLQNTTTTLDDYHIVTTSNQRASSEIGIQIDEFNLQRM